MNRRSLLLGTASVAALGAMATRPQGAIAQTAVYGIPSDFPTLADAVAALADQPAGQVITLVVESGHRPTAGLNLADGDYSRIRITAEDPVVHVHPSFTGHLMSGTRARLPILAALFDMEHRGACGMWIDRLSVAAVEPGAGVRNAGDRGLYVNAGSTAHADESIFTGSADRNVWVSRGSTLDAERANFSDSGGQNAVYVSRASRAHLESAVITGAANNGIVATRSWIDCSGADVSGAGQYGLLAERGGHLCADQSTAVGCGISGVYAEDGSFIQAKYVTATDSGSGVDIVVVRGSTVHAHGATTTNGVLATADYSVAALNTWTPDGAVFG